MPKPTDRISDAAMERLSAIMNDSPSILKLKGTEFEIRALRPGTQWLIAEEACKIIRSENASMGDVIKEFASNMPSVCRVIAYAIINDRRLQNKQHEDVECIYDVLMWGEYDMHDWATLLFQILNLIDVDFFFASTDAIATVRKMTLERKMTRKEADSSAAGQNGGR